MANSLAGLAHLAGRAIAYKTLPTLPYAAGLELMERTVVAKSTSSVDIVYLLQHGPVYTAGRRVKDSCATEGSRLRRFGAEYYEVPRGGQTTFHGPGQLVGYPIFSLKQLDIGVRCYVDALQATLIALCRGVYGLDAATNEHTGVWIGNSKIAALGIYKSHSAVASSSSNSALTTPMHYMLGIHVTRGITTHGFALNVCPEMKWFQQIIPCGIQGKSVTSLAQELQRRITVEEVVPELITLWSRLWGIRLVALSEMDEKWNAEVDKMISAIKPTN